MSAQMNVTGMNANSVRAFIARQETKGLLRFITCGSVDDGKSSLIGRLLHDSQKILEDHMAAVKADSQRWGTQGEEVDLALLVDGLQAEREQGITIDVAYRYFDTERRKFIIADTPGHEQYTRNMATGASTADLAVILVDAARGVQVQTRRHSFIVSLLGIRHVVVAVNKMDLVNYDQKVFQNIAAECRHFMRSLGIQDLRVVPVSALKGDNVVKPSTNMSWYEGQPLLEILDTVDVSDDIAEDLRFPVQLVSRPNADFRGYQGTIVAGHVRVGDQIMSLPSRKTSKVKEIVTMNGNLSEAAAPMAVTLTLEDEIDITRGDLLAHPDRAPTVAREFDAHIIWMAEQPLLPGKQYDFKINNQYVRGTIQEIEYRVDVNDLSRHKSEELKLNEIAVCKIALNHAVAYDVYDVCRESGSFIVVDRLNNATAGAGMIRRSAAVKAHEVHGNVYTEKLEVTRQMRANQKSQQPCILWFTGLSGAGKSTIANAVEQELFRRGYHSYLLDGDNVRHGLNRDLGFTDSERVENIRRIGEVARLFVDAGLIVLTAFISPFRSDRKLVRELVEAGEFIEVYVSTSLDICESRDPKGLYTRARQGQIKNFTGISSPYEAPEGAEIVLDTSKLHVDDCVAKIIEYLEASGRLKL
jgi:bifunctional enzyme CysN/CysC